MSSPDLGWPDHERKCSRWALLGFDDQQAFASIYRRKQRCAFSLGIPILDDVVEAVGGVAEGAVDLISGVPVIGGIIKGAVQIGDDIIETSISIAPTFDEIVETCTRVVDAVEGVVTDALGELEQWKLLGGGSINVNLDFTVLNRDSLFNTANAMTRAWGAGNGTELPLSGLRVEVHKWARFLLPTAFHATLRNDGTVGLEIAKGGSLRGQSGLCLRLSNDAAEIASGITENEFCDFSVQPGEPGFTDDLDHDVNREFRLNDWQLHALNQLTDANKFSRSVLRHVPPQAEVGVGFAANLVASGNKDQPLTACLTFPEGAQLLTETAALVSVVPGGAVVGAAGLLATPFIRRDMFLPETAEPRDSRGIVSHEYGHFIMCSLLHDIDPDALLRLYHDRLSEGQADARDDDVTVQSEAFADFIMSEVTSGTNYANFRSIANSNFANFCAAPPCIEENFRGLNEAPPLNDVFKDETRRYVSLFHDAFDRRSGLWRTDSSLPTNADAWEFVPPPPAPAPPTPAELRPATSPYLSDTDDRVQLPGSSTVDWFESAIPDCSSHAGPSQDCSLDGLVMQRGLVAAARHAGATWCDVCTLIANHSKNPSAMTRRLPDGLWQLCRDSQLESSIVGPPPDGQLRLDAATCDVCPPHQVSRVGRCLACPPDEVVSGNTCVPCPAGSAVGANFQCAACGAHAIVVNNKCVECEFYEAADRATNTCNDCPADVVIDWRDVPAACPTETITVASSPSPAGDTCPNDFWIEVTNLDDLVSRAEAAGDATLMLDGIEAVTATTNPTTQSSCELGHSTTSRLLGNAGDWVPLGGAQGSGKWTPASQCGDLDCLTPASCDFPTTLVPRAEIVGAPRNLRILSAAGFGNVQVPSRTSITATLAAGQHSRCRVR